MLRRTMNAKSESLSIGRRVVGRMLALTLATGVVAGLAACAGPATEPADGAGEGPRRSLALEPCHLSTFGLPQRVEAECGTLEVAENPDDPEGRRIELFVAVLPAVSRNAQPDPLFLLAGGPGQAASEAFLSTLGLLDAINKERDLVLVDQRGTGKSNRLQCFEDLALDELIEAGEDAILDLVEQCRDALAETADPRFYTTPIAMDDLDAVRAALGYEQINLYGVSYGTRAALTYLQRHEDRVRSVILDSVVPQDLALGSTVARDAQRAADLIFERCAADAGCAEAYPDVAGQLDALLTRLETSPRTVELAHPLSGEHTEVRMTRDVVASTVRLLSYTPETAGLLPLLIHQANTVGDLVPLAAQGVQIGGNLSASLAAGMAYSVQCAEDAPFLDAEQAKAWGESSYLGDFAATMAELCEIWPRGEVPEGFKMPVTSDVPVLLLSGQVDPVTPPEYGDRAAATLANSLHLVAPGQGHNVLPRGCVRRIAEDFLEGVGGVADSGSRLPELETECVQDLEPMPFFLSFTGPSA